MGRASFRFYGSLNDFLPPERRGAAFTHPFAGRPGVKDVVEALGVPHVEVALLAVDGEPVGFSHPLEDGARVSAWPAFQSLPVEGLRLATPPAPERPAFLLDVHLGKLARSLRLLGFDAEWSAQAGDAELAQRAAREGRVLLSRDVGLLKRSEVVQGYWPRSSHPRRQLLEVLSRYRLVPHVRPFQRCLRCNGPLQPVPKALIAARLPPHTRQTQEEFRQCSRCGHLYWAGSHHAQLEKLVAEVVAEAASA